MTNPLDYRDQEVAGGWKFFVETVQLLGPMFLDITYTRREDEQGRELYEPKDVEQELTWEKIFDLPP